MGPTLVAISTKRKLNNKPNQEQKTNARLPQKATGSHTNGIIAWPEERFAAASGVLPPTGGLPVHASHAGCPGGVHGPEAEQGPLGSTADVFVELGVWVAG